jgi:RNA methyltransferase, TrmH family
LSEALKPLKWYKQLSGKKDRLTEGAFLVEGPRAVAQVMTSSPDSIIEILTVEKLDVSFDSYPTRLLTQSRLNSICATQHPQGPIALVRLPEGVYSASLPDNLGSRLLLLEDVQDPGNVGTLIRTAAAFGFDGVILTSKCADPLSPKCVQASAGTVLSLWLRVSDDYISLASDIQERGYALVATDLDGDEDISALGKDKLLLTLGNEAAGLSSNVIDLADYRIKFPVVSAKAESLNVAACGAICMYLASRGA